MTSLLWKDLIVSSTQISRELGFPTKIYFKKENDLNPHQKNLYYVGLRNWGLTQVRVGRFCKKRPPEQLMAILSISFGMIEQKRYTNFTIVNQSVEAAKKLHGKRFASLLNFILRDILKDQNAAMHDKNNHVAKWNVPNWWLEKMKTQFKLQTNRILNVNRYHPPLSLRVSHSYKDMKNLKRDLENENTKVIQIGEKTLNIIPPYDIRITQSFKKGIISVQDYSSQKIIDFIKPEKNTFLLDACAAPGGKTFALASRYSSINIVSSDISKKRIQKLNKDLIRQKNYLLSTPKIVVADICRNPCREKLLSMTKKGFDYVILDAPCSGSGVVRRHPEIPWNRSIKQIKNLVSLQSNLLKNAWDLLKLDGILLYSVCSIFKEEGEIQIRNFLNAKQDSTLIESILLEPKLGPESYKSSNLTDYEKNYLGYDGFYYGVLKKQVDKKFKFLKS